MHVVADLHRILRDSVSAEQHSENTDFENFISDANIFVIPFTVQIAKYAAQIRAKYVGIKAMDALQLAFAIQNGCDAFLTNDKQLRQVTEIRTVLVDELLLT